MTDLIVTNAAIPDDAFQCPANNSGVDYATIPWSNLSVSALPTHPDPSGFCGVKGPHPRVPHCCKYGHLSPTEVANSSIALAAADSCTQYCAFHTTSLDLWLYCLTEEGDTVSNAFCVSSNDEYYYTSGTEERDGPFDPDAPIIKDYQNSRSAAPSIRASGRWAWGLLGVSTLVACIL